MGLPRGSIFSFFDFSKNFVTCFSFNIEDIDILDLLNDKQHEGETFASYLQRWRALASRLKSSLVEELVSIFVAKYHLDLDHNLHLHCITTFTKVIEKDTIIERALIAKGLTKIFKEDKDKQSGDKSHY